MMRGFWLLWLGAIVVTYGAGQVVAVASGGPMLSDVIREFTYRHPILVFVAGGLVAWAAMHFWGDPRQ